MKKIYSLLCLLLAFVGGVSTAWADTQTVPQLSTDGSMHYYTIKNLRSNKYIYWDGDGKDLQQSTQLNNGCYFYFTAGTAITTAEGVTVMKIHNLMSANLMADWSSWNANGSDWYSKVVTNGATGVAFGKSATFNTTDGTRDCWNDYNYDHIGSYFVDGDGSLFNVEEVDLPTYDVDFADGSKFVFGNLLHSDYVKAADNLTRGGTADSYAYEFTLLKQENGNYKIYNSYLNKYVASLPVENGGIDVNVPLVESLGDAQDYKIAAAPKFGYITLQSTQTNLPSGSEDKCFLHMSSTGIVRWSAGESDRASYFRLISPTDFETAWNNAIKSKANAVVNNKGTGLGNFSDVSEVQSALTSFNEASDANKAAAYATLENAINTTSRNVPEDGKYYVIGSAVFDGKYVVEDYGNLRNNSNKLYSKSYGNNIVPALWQFEESDKEGYFHIKAANSSEYARLTTWGDGASYMVGKDDEYLGYYKICNSLDDGNFVKTNKAVNLRCLNKDKSMVDGTMHSGTNGYDHTDTGEGEIISWNLACDGNQFTISEVTSVPVSITAAKYATLHLPFAVNIPSNVRAFIGVKNNNDEIILKELEGVIPAKTPVILAGEQGKYDFDINYENLDAAPANALSGTLVPYTIADGVSAYILKNGTHGVGLYKVTSTTDRTIGANKAYFQQGTTNSEPASFAFSFEDVTGINQAAASSDADNVYYDLNGRRVLYPVHGIYVKGNGQKVYIK